MNRIVIFFSNLKERILMNMFNRITSSYRYVIVEGDTTSADRSGEYPVSNAAITLSKKVANEILQNTQPYTDLDRYPDYYCALVYRQASKQLRHSSEEQCNFCIAINPDMSNYKENPILSPIQYDQKWHTNGFQPCTPTTMRMLHTWHLPSTTSIVMPVFINYDYTNRCYYYEIANPEQRGLIFRLLSRIILRNTFRFPDNRTNTKKR